MSWFLTNLIAAFLLPPLNLLLAALAGLLLLRSRPRLGRALLTTSFTLLWLCSTPYIAGISLYLLEVDLHPVNTRASPADAIVVLGGGSYPKAPEYGENDTVGSASLERLRYAAKLQRETGKPVLVTGGNPVGNNTPEAQQMKTVLEKEFNVPVKWAEDTSGSTFENAQNSFRILQQAGIKRIYLVTHSWHMPRSIMAFHAAGFDVVPAPLSFSLLQPPNLWNLIPSADGLERSRIVMHELIGLLWYRLKS